MSTPPTGNPWSYKLVLLVLSQSSNMRNLSRTYFCPKRLRNPVIVLLPFFTSCGLAPLPMY